MNRKEKQLEEGIEELKEACKGSIAKAGDGHLPLWMHLVDTALTAEYLFECWLPESVQAALKAKDLNAESFAVFLAGIHDLGKDTVSFQNQRGILEQAIESEFQYLNALKGYSESEHYRHEELGEAIVRSFGSKDPWLDNASAAVGAHHGEFQNKSKQRKLQRKLNMRESVFYGKVRTDQQACTEWTKDWKEITDSIKKIADLDWLEKPFLYQNTEMMIFSGLTVMADWIASNTDYFPLIHSPQEEKVSVYPERVNHALSVLDLPQPRKTGQDSVPSDFEESFGFSPNNLQKKVMLTAEQMSQPGLMIIEAPMGSGKTEAALAAANIFSSRFNINGIFFGLPTQASANGLFGRIAKWADKSAGENTVSIRLAHGKAQMNAEYAGLMENTSGWQHLEANDWLAGRKRQLLSDVVVGTVDQALLSSVRQKHVMLRFLGLSGKTVILDEIHSFDDYTNQIIERFLNWMGAMNVPVILMTATLSDSLKKRFTSAYLNDESDFLADSSAYPSVTWTDSGKPHCESFSAEEKLSRKIQLKWIPKENPLKSLTEILEESLQEGGKAAVICNTVASCQDIGHQLEEKFSDAEVIVFHGRFTDKDRTRIEQEVMSRCSPDLEPDGRKLIVVATQVIEQSLDISFDLMMTELCPVDLLLQRIGREHRKTDQNHPERLKKATCWIFNWDDESISRIRTIYSPYLLKKTRNVLAEKEELNLPEDISSLVTSVFDTAPGEYGEDAALKDEYEKYKTKIRKLMERVEPILLEKPDEEKTLDGLFGDTGALTSDAVVRSGAAPLEVILLEKHSNGQICPAGSPDLCLNARSVETNDLKEMEKFRIRIPWHIAGKLFDENRIQQLGEVFPHWNLQKYDSKQQVLVLEDEDEYQYSSVYGLERKQAGLNEF